ncbi:hypothetical protein QWZ16_07585 [Vibrio ostreicida]|uniref:Transposase n=1 Tax=Vibrio ostreicida TaxID=526588 RepID=A0ABT8BTW1_9VIBR|nr:hypothetical protein [Vibrio ostreicida]MDN3609562.1 hypothetical protein [Vibrio ostreicida]
MATNLDTISTLLISLSHGTECTDRIVKYTHFPEEAWRLRFQHRRVRYFNRHGLASGENAFGVLYTLMTAGKRNGLKNSPIRLIRHMAFITQSATGVNVA